ncbi:signal peptidase I [Arthrobacter sp. KK5.5]|uniref:signal peptidase I n=1 Tax=Arthrobacter sp. KK5.5 TaxID=3373084 RepID=UPI003EE493DE
MNEQESDSREDGPSGPTAGERAWGWLKEVLIVIGIALVLSFVIKTFFFRAFYIPSGSMEPTLEIDDRIFVNLMVPGPFDLTRGDVVVFRDDQDWLGETLPMPTDPVTNFLAFVGLVPDSTDQHLVKRVIGLPGDTVQCCGSDGRLSVNGEPVTEPYIWPGAAPSDEEFKVTVPEGKLWVMGDHRDASADSRFHRDAQGGFVDVETVEGKASVIAWPLNRAGVVDGEHEVFNTVPDDAGASGAGK